MNILMKPLAAAALTACALAAQADTALGPYTPVTDARLANPEPPTGCSTAATTAVGATARWRRSTPATWAS